MYKLLIGLVLVSSIAAQAQTSSTSATTVAPAEQTSTATVTEVKPADASKFGMTVLVGAFANVGDVRTEGGSAAIDTVNGLGLSYKLTDKIKVEARYNFQARNRKDSELSKAAADYLSNLYSEQGDSLYKTLDPTLHASYKSDFSMLGAAPMTFGARYYVPVSKDAQNNGSYGILRYQTSLSWDLNPLVNIEASAQQRIYMYNKITKGQYFNSTGGTELRTMLGVTGTYNFNDKINAYYGPTLDLWATRAFRGDFQANKANYFIQEVGMNFTAGPVTINPAFATIAVRSADTEGYSGAGMDEMSEYDLTISASF